MTTRLKTPLLLQMEAVECGAAALGIVLRYYGHYAPLEELRVVCGVSRDGINALNILKAAQGYGLETNGLRRSTLESLRDVALPAILYWNFNHFVVLEGFDRDHAYLNDPAVGRRIVSLSEMDGAYTGLVLTFKPTPAFKKRGQPFRLLRALTERLHGYRTALAFVMLTTLFMVVPSFVVPVFLRVFVDDILIGGQDWIAPLLLGMAAVAVLRGMLKWLQGSALLRLEIRLGTETAAGFFWHALNLPYLFYTQRAAGDIASRVIANDRITHLITGELAITFINLLLSAFYVVLMLTYSPLLTLIGVTFALLNLLILRFISRRQAAANQRLQQERGKLTSAITSGLRSIETLKALGAESTLFARWTGLQASIVNVEQEVGTLTNWLAALSVFLFAVSATLILGVGGTLVLNGALSVGMVVAFQSILFGFNDSIERVIGLVNRVQEAEGDLNRLEDVLNTPRDPATIDSAEGNTALTGQVEVRDVSFGFNPLQAPFLQHISLNIKAGERVALVGTSGSGKSTVARLIAGLYPAWRGEIYFDGMSREQLPRAAITSAVALVDQQTALFSGTILDNLTLWDNTVITADVMQAAKDAAIHERITQLPQHYHAHVEENGGNFSGGERQRFEIARALVGKPKLLILDEATSALDSETETRVLENIAWRGCACLIITHRLATVRDCHRILVLDGGRIVEQGSHDELIDQNGVYASLLNSDQLEAEPLPVEKLTLDGAAEQYKTLLNRPKGLHQTDALTSACEQIGQALGVSITIPARLSAYKYPALEIAACSGLGVRRVALTNVKRIEAFSAVLAVADHQPVVLLQGARITPTAYEPTAFLFYKPLPTHLNVEQVFQFAWQMIRANVGVILAVGIVSGLLGIALPLLTSVVFDDVIPARSQNQMLLVVIVLILSSAALALFQVLRGAAALRIQGLFDSFLQTALWNRLLNLPVAFFRAFDAGDLAERAVGIGAVKSIIADAVALSLLTGLFSVFNFGVLFALDVPLALVALALAVLLMVFTSAAGLWRLGFQKTIVGTRGRITGVVLQLLNSVAKLRVAAAEGRAFKVWLGLFNEQQRALFAMQRIQLGLQVIIAVYPLLASMLIFALAYERGTLTTGMFLAFNLAFAQLIIAGSSLSGTVINALMALPFIERIAPLLAAIPELESHRELPGDISGAIRIENVSFRYQPDAPLVLDDVSLDIKAGEYVVIVGASGSGKSTLMRLLLGFETPEKGTIFYDGKSLDTLHLQVLRRQMGSVMQGAQLIGGTIFSNIVGARDLTVDDAWYAAQLAEIAEDIRQLPMGMDTVIGEENAAFSGGQKQRLLIARALAFRPRIILFDEATSSLDEITQARVMRNLGQLGVTRILITHRSSMLHQADRIFLLHEGRLQETTEPRGVGWKNP